MLAALEQVLNVKLAGQPRINQSVQLDGFVDGEQPICVEAWAHQGRAKGSQPAKVMKDICKLLLVERLIGKPCRKILVVCDADALRFFDNSWLGRFANEFDIERVVVSISESRRDLLRAAQQRQFR